MVKIDTSKINARGFIIGEEEKESGEEDLEIVRHNI